MDIYKFFNSRDIAAHLKDLRQTFTPLEVAWIISQSKRTTLRERHEAWQEIIDTLPDCRVPERLNCRGRDSLHTMLRAYMDMENKYISQFFKDESGCAYQYQIVDMHDSGFWSLSPELWISYTEMKEHIAKTDDPYHTLRMRKAWIGSKKKIDLEISPTEDIITVEVFYEDSEEDMDLIYYSFFGMYFRFPLPFQTGDVICDWRDNELTAEDIERPSPMVYLDSHLMREDRLNHYCYRSSADMTAHTFSQDRTGVLIREEAMEHLCMDMEFYHGDFTGIRKIIKTLSDYVKNKIDLISFANAYHFALMEESGKDYQNELHIVPSIDERLS